MATSSEIEELGPFKQYDTTSVDHSDHKFTHHAPPLYPSRTFQAAVMADRNRLRDHLPEGIYVRAYEDRIDLMRAVIVGKKGTPYHDGLFVFDIHFSPEYPWRAPSVMYWSCGGRINPYLYEDGSVCGSLIRWNPHSSTILKVLTAIQGLLQTEKPYYSKPRRYSALLSNSDDKSQTYNDEAFLLSCNNMVSLMDKPPKGFTELVGEHFRNHARTVLAACGSYANGRVPVGSYLARPDADPGSYIVTEKFASSVKRVYPRLFDSFRYYGACICGFSRDLSIEERVEAILEVAKKSESYGVLGKMFEMFKKSINGISSSNSSSQVSPKFFLKDH